MSVQILGGLSLGVLLGIVIIIGVVVLLIKQYETRMVLIGAGFLMAILSWNLMAAFTAFTDNMVVKSLVLNICSALGFAGVLQLTQCDKHLVFAMARGLKHIRPFLIPAAALATFLINIAIPTAAGCAAATGVIMIPLLVSQGVHPVIAASAIMLGTFGSMFSPGLAHNPVIAELTTAAMHEAGTLPAGETFGAMDVIKTLLVPTLVCFGIGAASLTVVAFFRKENAGYVDPSLGEEEKAAINNFKVNPFLAVLPMMPIVLLIGASLLSGELNSAKSIAGSADAAPEAIESAKAFMSRWGWAKGVLVPHAMLLGAFLCLLFTRTSPSKATRYFFDGMGKGYGDVISIIIAAGVFVGGMNALGLIDAGIKAMKETTNIAGIAASYGPFLLGVVSGSGDAAAMAFNKAVTIHASAFGFETANMGALAALGGSLGRTMSPIAGAAILLAGIAKVNPMEMAKRNAPGMILASVAAMVLLLYVS
ncbi:MAG: C4-dicarboxylate transporter DcuC [Burkholderiales bacterium]|nr:C4-dicarboxylate transporter DcuC [Burkholderiales bacterium]